MLKYYLLITVTSSLSSAHMNVNTTAPANVKSMKEEDNKKLEDEQGVIIGGIVGGLIFLSLMVTILAFLVRRKNNSKTPESATPERRGSVSTSNQESDTRPASDKSGIYVVSAMVTTAGIGSSYTCDRDTNLGYSTVQPNFRVNVATPAQAGLGSVGQMCQAEGTTPLSPASSIIHVMSKLGRRKFFMRGEDNSEESKEGKGSYELNVKSGHDLAVGTITGGHGLSTKMSSSVEQLKDLAGVTVSQVASTCGVNHEKLSYNLGNNRCVKKSTCPHLSPRDSQKQAIRDVSNSNSPLISFSENNEIESLNPVGMKAISSSVIISGQVTIGQLSCDNPIKITKKSHHKTQNVPTIDGCFIDSRQETVKNSAKEDKRKEIVRKDKRLELHCSHEGQSFSDKTHAPEEFNTSILARQDDNLKLEHIASNRCSSHQGNKHTSPRTPAGRQRRFDFSDNGRRSEREITQQNTSELTNNKDIPATSNQESSFCGNAGLKKYHQENLRSQKSSDAAELRMLGNTFLPPVQVEEKNIDDKRSSNISDNDHDENCEISKWYKNCSPQSRRFSGENIRFNTSLASPSVTQRRMLSLPLVLFPNHKRNVPEMTEFPLASLRFDNGYLNDCAHSGVGEERQREGVRPVGSSHEPTRTEQDTDDKKDNCATAALVESTVSSFCGQLLFDAHPTPTVEKYSPSSCNLPDDGGQQSGSHHFKEDHSKRRRQPAALQAKLTRKSNTGSDKAHERRANVPLGINLSNQRSLAQHQQLLRIKTDNCFKSSSLSPSVINLRDNIPPKPKENTSVSQFYPHSGKNLTGSQKHPGSMSKASKCLDVVHKRGFPLQNTCVTTDDCKPNHIINRRREEFLRNLWQSVNKEDKLFKNHGVKMAPMKTHGEFNLPEKGVGGCNVSRLGRAYFPIKELSFPRRCMTMDHLLRGHKSNTKPPLTRSMSVPQANLRVSEDGKEKRRRLKSSKAIRKVKSTRISVPSSLTHPNPSPKSPVYFGIPPSRHPSLRQNLNRSKCSIRKPPSLDWSVGSERLSSYRETNHTTGTFGKGFRTASLFSRYMNSPAD